MPQIKTFLLKKNLKSLKGTINLKEIVLIVGCGSPFHNFQLFFQKLKSKSKTHLSNFQKKVDKTE